MCVCFSIEKKLQKSSLLLIIVVNSMSGGFFSFFLFSLSYWKNVLQLGKNDDVHVNHTLSSNLDFLYKTEGKIQVVIQ